LAQIGNVYGIVRENTNTISKIATDKQNLVAENLRYILAVYKTRRQKRILHMPKAIKHLNLKFNSLNEAFGKSEEVNVFKNDNLTEDIAGFSDGTSFWI